MYARRRSIRRRSTRNSDRTPPPTSIGNHCNPTVSRNIDFGYFRDTVLPVALANKWMDINGSISFYDYTIPSTFTGTQQLPPLCVGLYQFGTTTGTEIEYNITNDSGNVISLKQENLSRSAVFTMFGNVHGVCLHTRMSTPVFNSQNFPVLDFISSIEVVTNGGAAIHCYCLQVETRIDPAETATLFVNPTKSTLIMPRVTSHL